MPRLQDILNEDELEFVRSFNNRSFNEEMEVEQSFADEYRRNLAVQKIIKPKESNWQKLKMRFKKNV